MYIYIHIIFIFIVMLTFNYFTEDNKGRGLFLENVFVIYLSVQVHKTNLKVNGPIN